MHKPVENYTCLYNSCGCAKYISLYCNLAERVAPLHETENSPFQAAEKRLIRLSPCLFWNSPPQTRLDRFL